MLSQNQMVKAMKTARKSIESMYCGTCDVVIKESYEADDYTTKFRDVTLIESEPCRLTNKSNNKASLGNVPEFIHEIKVLINPDIVVPEGSKLIISQNGITEAYKNSGKSMMYNTHQEILLELEDEA